MAADPLTAVTVDGILNYDSTDNEDPFNDKPARTGRDDKSTLSPRRAKRKPGDDERLAADLGLDEEVKITKKRKPIAKLDEARSVPPKSASQLSISHISDFSPPQVSQNSVLSRVLGRYPANYVSKVKDMSFLTLHEC
jgi:hypothetical protein